MNSQPNSTTAQYSINSNRAKTHIQTILNQLLSDFRASKAERQQLALWEESQEFTILGIIEMFTIDIRGYAAQIVVNNFVNEPQNCIDCLEALQIFEIPYVADWYSTIDQYPQIKQYISHLDYLRLLIIEYVSKCQIDASTAA
jgi:hypothetical protein